MKKNIKTITNLTFVLFGALGDLALRKLFYSLFVLFNNELINNKIKILCLARKFVNVNTFRYKIYKRLIKTKKIQTKKELVNFIKLIKCLKYSNIDFTILTHYTFIKKIQHKSPFIFYLSVSSALFKIICKYLNLTKCLTNNAKIILEKPIGCNFKSSIKINNYISNIFFEPCIFRIDHYLGKRQVKNLLYLRFLNPMFNNLWKKKYISHIKIILAENLGIEDRWAYFDKTGQLRDMVQNHLLQILSIITLCIPHTFPNPINYKQLYKEKIKILKDLNNSFLTADINYGQYISTKVNNKILNGYLEENNSNKNSSTETFVSIKTKINNVYWYGIPFILITGKRLKTKISQIKIYFTKILCNYDFKNKLTINLQPKENITFNMFNIIQRSLTNKNLLDSYEFLLLEVMKGKQDFFVSKEEIEYSWRWIDKLIYIWKQKNIPMSYYKSFTWGPKKT